MREDTFKTWYDLIKQVKLHPHKCCVYTGLTSVSGYGKVSIGGWKFAHRIVYEEFKGPISAGMVIRHICNNKLCINPLHLLMGTYADNSRDMVMAGRCRNQSKLTLSILNKIKTAKRGTLKLYSIRYNTALQTIYNIRSGHNWKTKEVHLA